MKRLCAAVLVVGLTLSCAPGPSAVATTPGIDPRCALVQLASRIPAEVRTAIAAARRGDAAAAEAAMVRAQAAASQLHGDVDAMGSRLVVTSRARFVSAEAFAQQADELFLGTSPDVPNTDTLAELERGVAQVESLLTGVAAPCSS